MTGKVKSKKVKGKIFGFHRKRAQHFLVFHFCFFTFFFLLAVSARAQVDEPPADVAPPPPIVIPKEQKKILDAEKDLKKRTQLSLKLLDEHLLKAEEFTAQNQFQQSINRLGNYQAVLENAYNFLKMRDNGSGKVDDNFKRLEIGLRKTVSRLEVLRREMPFNYGYYVRELQKVVREIRGKALEPLFDDSIVRQKPS